MAYHNEYAFSMPQVQQPNMFFPQQMPFAGFPQHQLQPDPMALPYSRFPDYPEHMYYHDFEEVTETTTKPRLTKQQVDQLESEFQRNEKPNSAKKRWLAQVTSLALPRVSNWFQNRRAKAKQQRKQAEYESTQQKEAVKQEEQADESEDDEEPVNDDDDAQESESNDPVQVKTSDTPQPDSDHQQDSPKLEHGVLFPPTANRENAQASLERALIQARNARAAQETYRASQADLNDQHSMAGFAAGHIANQRYTQNSQLDAVSWKLPSDAQESWLPGHLTGNEIGLDFDFSAAAAPRYSERTQLPSPTESSSQSLISSESWNDCLVTPTMANASHGAQAQSLPSPDMGMSAFADCSRRPSIANTLAQGFDQIELVHSLSAQSSVESSCPTTGVDLASRRRRPRPAALTSTALRSRSYGTLTNSSPTFKPGMTPPPAQALRHVKSTGHCLNNHYAGIRKSSMHQKSPLAISFQESEELKRLVAQRAFEEDAKQQRSPINAAETHGTPTCQDMTLVMSQPVYTNPVSTSLPQQRTNIQSPPVTPFNQNFFQYGPAMLPQSIQQQYAMVSETPPYSAGPLTHSSFQDRPFISPDVPNFPQTQLIPNLPCSTAGDEHALSSWMYADHSPVYTTCTPPTGNRESEWHVHEFPDQREKLADTAKFLDRPTIKSWAFDNRGQNDFAS